MAGSLESPNITPGRDMNCQVACATPLLLRIKWSFLSLP